MNSSDLVKASAVLRNTVRGQINWEIENFKVLLEETWSLESKDFVFFFPQVCKTFRFRLETAKKEYDRIFHYYFRLINRSFEDVRISADLKVGKYDSRCLNETVKVGAKQEWSYFSDTQIPAGTLSIQVMYSIYDSFVARAADQLAPKPDANLSQVLKILLTDKTFCDFTIECGTEKFSCHKAILANRSDVFARLFSSEDWAENKENLLQIKDHDPEVVKQMLEFIYSNKIPDDTQCSLELLLIADQFNIEELIQFCQPELAKSLTCENALQMLDTASKVTNATLLEEYVTKFVAKNILKVVGTEDWKKFVDPNPELLEAIKNIKL